VTIEPADGVIEVVATVRLVPTANGRGGGAGEVCFLLAPGLEITSANEAAPPSRRGPASSPGQAQSTALRRVPLAVGRAGPAPTSGQTELRLAYRGRLPAEWITPASTELAIYNLWFPVFSGSLPAFSFHALVRVPSDSVTAASGRLLPLPPSLRPQVHNHVVPRAYLWESASPVTDIAICSGPYLVHQRRLGTLTVEVFSQGDGFVLGEPYLELTEQVLDCLGARFGPLEQPGATPDAYLDRLGLVITPKSIQGGYARPGHIVLPQPMAAGILEPGEEQSTALWLAHEMAHLWFGGLLESDTVTEPWLSEGFAEYGQLLFLRARWGTAAYREALSRYAGRVAQIDQPPPLAGVRADHPEMDTLARCRGALLLAGLHEAVGDRMMTEFMTGFVVRYAGRAVTTHDFAVYARGHLDKDAWRLVAAGLGGEGAEGVVSPA
jgi:hypothetical protein